MLLTFGAFSQTTMTGSGDTITNTETEYVTITLSGSGTYVAIQVVATKLSGTVDGTVLLQGSVDGVNYVDISTDTLQLANVTTNTKVWSVTGNPYLYYRLAGTGVGTMAARFYGYAVRKN